MGVGTVRSDGVAMGEGAVLNLSCSRRRFIGSTSLLALSAAVPEIFSPRGAQTPAILMSQERWFPATFWPNAVLLDGPRISRLQVMAEKLPMFVGEFVLRLDATDDSLLDVAAQLAGVHIRRGAALPDGLGIRARISSIARNFA
jgi:hypothetical protein